MPAETLNTVPDTLRSPERQIPSIRVIINGQGDGAAKLLDKVLEDGHEVVGVVATVNGLKEGNPDPLRAKAMEHRTPIVNLGDINTTNKNFSKEKYDAANQKLEEMNADISIGFFLQPTMSDETIDIPEFGSYNTHFSLLPKNAGRDSMSRDVLEGNDFGITVFKMNSEIDAGDVADQTSFHNPDNRSQGALYYHYLENFVEFVGNSVNKLAIGIDEHRKNGTPLPLTPQDLSKRTYYGPLTSEELEVDFTKETALIINRKMNAGKPGATAMIEGVKMKIEKPTRLEGPPYSPGRSIKEEDGTLTIEAAQGLINIGRRQKVQ